MTQIKFVKEIPVINGTYKKDTPNKDIGYQKWRVRKTYEVEMEYEIVAKTKKEAEDLLEKKECVNVEDVSGDEPVEWKKIEECIPREDTDIDTDKVFLNYEDPDWSKDDFEWYKKEDGTDVKKNATTN